MARLLAPTLSTLALAWLLVLLLAPAAIAARRPAAAVPAALTYHAAGRICHQRPERSFRLAGVQLPVCARCFGLYAAGALGALLAWIPRARPRGVEERWVIIACAVPTAVTWGLEVTGVAPFTNMTRAMAALPLGAAAGWIFVRGLRSSAIS